MPAPNRHSLYIVLFCLNFILAGCSRPDPELALRQSLSELISAIEQKQQRSVSEKLSRNFRGNGRLDQRTMTALVFRYYLRYKYIKIFSAIETVEISGNKARMVFYVALTSSRNILPEHMRTYRISSRWVLVDGQWKMAKANWVEVQARSVLPLFNGQFGG